MKCKVGHWSRLIRTVPCECRSGRSPCNLIVAESSPPFSPNPPVARPLSTHLLLTFPIHAPHPNCSLYLTLARLDRPFSTRSRGSGGNYMLEAASVSSPSSIMLAIFSARSAAREPIITVSGPRQSYSPRGPRRGGCRLGSQLESGKGGGYQNLFITRGNSIRSMIGQGAHFRCYGYI